MKRWMALACCCAALLLTWSSNVHAASTFFVSASKTVFIWGESAQVAATLTDESGVPLPTGAVTWSVIPSTAATVGVDGVVTPLALTTFTVRAQSAGFTGEVRMQVLPKRIAVAPERATMPVGSTQRMRANVMDISDRPIPNATVSWAVSSEFFNFSTSATIDASGMLRAVQQARIRVVARISYSGTVPGFSSMTQGDALVDIKAPATYKFERIFVARRPSSNSSVLAPRAAQLIPTGTGGFMFASSLDGLGAALLEWNNGDIKTLLNSGRVNPVNGYPLANMASYTRTSSGEVLVQELDLSGRVLVSRGASDAITPIFADGTVVFGAEQAGGFDVKRNSLADSGAMALRVNYTDSVTRLRTSGVFRGFDGGISELVLNSSDPRMMTGETQGRFDTYGIANDGTVWFLSTPNQIWRSRPGAPPERMLAAGDRVGNETVTGYFVNYSPFEEMLFVAGNGDVVNAVFTNNGPRFLLWHDGDSSPSAVLSVGAAYGLYGYDPERGALLDVSLPGRARGLYRWKPDGSTQAVLLLNATSIDGSPVEEIVSATDTSDGAVYAMVRTANNPMIIARLSPNVEVVLKAGDSVPVSVQPVITALIPGARTGTPMIIAGGVSGSVAQLETDGTITPVIRVGTKLPDGKFYAGSKLNMVRTTPDGRIVFGHDYFASDSSLFTWNQGRIELTVRAPLRHASDNTNIGSAINIEVNRTGDIAFQMSWNCCGLYRLRNGRLTTVADERTQITVDGVAIGNPAIGGIDDAGNILFRGNRVDGTSFYVGVWDGGAARISVAPGMSMPDGRQVTSVGALRGCTEGFAIGVVGAVARYRNGVWNYLVDPSLPLATGAPANTLNTGSYDANRSCETVFNDGSGIGAFVGGKYHEIQDLQQLTPDGDLLSVSQLLINDDATIFVLGANDSGEEVIYRASPIGGPVETTFAVRASGAFSATTSGGGSVPTVGYAGLQSSVATSAFAIFGNRQGGVLVSEAAVPAARPIRAGRIFAEVVSPINTGIAIANPNNQEVSINFSLTRADGSEASSGTFSIAANRQTASFLDQAPFNAPANFVGALSFSSSSPVSVIALRGNSNRRGEFLMTTLPVLDLDQAPSLSAAMAPHFATGGGWTTQIVLVNPTNTPISGNIEFYSSGSDIAPGALMPVNAGGQSANRFAYQIQARGSYKLSTAGTEPAALTGSVRIAPTGGQAAPSAVAIFSFAVGGTVVSEAGVAGFGGTGVQVYAEASGVPFSTGSIQTGIAIANPSNQPVVVTADLRRIDGTSAGLQPATVAMPANGHAGIFVNQLFPSLTLPFRGVLRLTSPTSISVAGIRGRTNERNEFLLTTTPPSGLAATESSGLFFPHLVDGGGYTTQIVVMGSASSDASGVLHFVGQTGQPLTLTLR